MSKRDVCGKLFLILLLCALLTGCSDGKKEDSSASSAEGSASVTETILIPQPEPPPEPDMVSYPAFIDQHFDKKHHTLTLSNDKTNAVSFRFTLTDSDGAVLLTTDPIPAGEKTAWDVTERWSKSGHHTLTILSTPISEDGTEGNSVRQTIKIYLSFAQ